MRFLLFLHLILMLNKHIIGKKLNYLSRSRFLSLIFFNESIISIIVALRSFHLPSVTSCQSDDHRFSPLTFTTYCDDWDCYTLSFLLDYFHFIIHLKINHLRREGVRKKMNDRTSKECQSSKKTIYAYDEGLSFACI